MFVMKAIIKILKLSNYFGKLYKIILLKKKEGKYYLFLILFLS